MAFSDTMQIAGLIFVALSGLAGIAVYLERKTVSVFDARLGQVDVKIDGVRLNQRENVDATLDAIQRVEQLEVTINNGLTHRTQQTAADVAEIKSAQHKMFEQLAEIHGWLKAKERF